MYLQAVLTDCHISLKDAATFSILTEVLEEHMFKILT